MRCYHGVLWGDPKRVSEIHGQDCVDAALGGINPSLPESAERFNPNVQVITVWGHQNPDLVQAAVRTETDLWANADVKVGSGRVPDRNLAC
jgi:hypothetical protein